MVQNHSVYVPVLLHHGFIRIYGHVLCVFDVYQKTRIARRRFIT